MFDGRGRSCESKMRLGLGWPRKRHLLEAAAENGSHLTEHDYRIHAGSARART